jgi:hypothetical protein
MGFSKLFRFISAFVLAVAALYIAVLAAGFLYSLVPSRPPNLSLRLVGYEQCETNLVATLVLSNSGPSVAWVATRNWRTEATVGGVGVTNDAVGLTIGPWPLRVGSNETVHVVIPAGSQQWRARYFYGYYSRRNPRMDLVSWLYYRSPGRRNVANALGPILDPFVYGLRFAADPQEDTGEVRTPLLTEVPNSMPSLDPKRMPGFRSVTEDD